MLKDITLGQYFPGNTVVHRLDPRTKLLMTLLYIVALFLCKWFVSYGLMLVFLLTAILLSKIRPKALFKGLKPLIIIIAFTAIINLFPGWLRYALSVVMNCIMIAMFLIYMPALGKLLNTLPKSNVMRVPLKYVYYILPLSFGLMIWHCAFSIIRDAETNEIVVMTQA